MYHAGSWIPGQPDPYAAYSIPAAVPAAAAATATPEDVSGEAGKCQRKEPPCKYLHPPQHLKEQLLQNGRQNLAFKYQWNSLLAQNQLSQYPAPLGIPGMGISAPVPGVPMTNPYLYGHMPGQIPGVAQLPAIYASNPALDGQGLPQIPTSSVGSPVSSTATGGKAPRADRLEIGLAPTSVAQPSLVPTAQAAAAVAAAAPAAQAAAAGGWPLYQGTAAAAAALGAAAQTAGCTASTSAVNVAQSESLLSQANKRKREEELLMPAAVQGMTGVVPIKRQALDGKGGLPVFQPAMYQQLAQAYNQGGQPTYVPVSFEGYQYMNHHQPAYVQVAGHPTSVPRL